MMHNIRVKIESKRGDRCRDLVFSWLSVFWDVRVSCFVYIIVVVLWASGAATARLNVRTSILDASGRFCLTISHEGLSHATLCLRVGRRLGMSEKAIEPIKIIGSMY